MSEHSLTGLLACLSIATKSLHTTSARRSLRAHTSASPHNTQHLDYATGRNTRAACQVRSTLAWITDKEFTGSPQYFSLSSFPLYCLTHTVSVCPCSPISRPLGLLHSLPCHTRRQAARIYADHKPRSYKRSTYAHSHILYTGTVCLCCNVLDPCHGFTFSFTLPMSITTQLFFRCYAALRQAQGKHRNRQFGAHARGSMARPLPSQSFTSLPLLLDTFAL